MAKKANSMHLLVIRLSAMGDVAMTVPVLLALRKAYPKLKITVLTKPHLTPLFAGIPNLEVLGAKVTSDHKGIVGLWRLSRQIRQLEVTHIADFHNVLRSKILTAFHKIYGLPVARIDKGRAEKKALVRAEKKNFKQLKTTHDRYREVLLQLGFKLPARESHVLNRPLLEGKLRSLLGPKDEKVVGIAPFATYPGKMYELKRMEEVIQGLVALGNIQVLLFGGGKHEVALLDSCAAKYGDAVLNIAGKYSLEEELKLIAHLDVMVAMDSGNGHLAANYGVPVLTIWGVTHPFAGFAPYGQPTSNALLPNREKYPLIPTSVYGNKYPESYKDAINSIPSSLVLDKVKQVLKN